MAASPRQSAFVGDTLFRGWVSYPRPKTGVAGRAKVWSATVEPAMAKRPEPRGQAHRGLMFIMKRGEAGNDPFGLMFKRLLLDLDLHKLGIGVYSLRRTFRTLAGQVRDTHAVDLVMGHATEAPDMGALYTQTIDDDGLDAVAAQVRARLFHATPKPKPN
jgi:integrase